jgi:hypothetical protein
MFQVASFMDTRDGMTTPTPDGPQEKRQVVLGCVPRVLIVIGVVLAGTGVKALARGGDGMGAWIGIVLGLAVLGGALWLQFRPRDQAANSAFPRM